MEILITKKFIAENGDKMQIYEIKMILFETRTIKAKNYKQALGIAQEYFAGSDPETEIYRIDKKGKRHWIWVK